MQRISIESKVRQWGYHDSHILHSLSVSGSLQHLLVPIECGSTHVATFLDHAALFGVRGRPLATDMRSLLSEMSERGHNLVPDLDPGRDDGR